MNVLERKMLEDGVPMTKEKRDALKQEAALEKEKEQPKNGEITTPLSKEERLAKARSARSNGRTIRQRISSTFLFDMHEKWLDHGPDVIDSVIREEPATYLKCMASILPKEVDMTVTKTDDYTDEQLRTAIAARVKQAIALGVIRDVRTSAGGDRESTEQQALPPVSEDGTKKA